MPVQSKDFNTISQSVSQWVSQWQGHLLSCSGQLKRIKSDLERFGVLVALERGAPKKVGLQLPFCSFPPSYLKDTYHMKTLSIMKNSWNKSCFQFALLCVEQITSLEKFNPPLQVAPLQIPWSGHFILLAGRNLTEKQMQVKFANK